MCNALSLGDMIENTCLIQTFQMFRKYQGMQGGFCLSLEY